MKYTNEITNKLLEDFHNGVSPAEIAEKLDVPVKSVIAKLSSLGVYKKKAYVNKNGQPPVKKSEYIDKLAVLLEMDIDTLDSLEKVNKVILVKLIQKLTLN